MCVFCFYACPSSPLLSPSIISSLVLKCLFLHLLEKNIVTYTRYEIDENHIRKLHKVVWITSGIFVRPEGSMTYCQISDVFKSGIVEVDDDIIWIERGWTETARAYYLMLSSVIKLE